MNSSYDLCYCKFIILPYNFCMVYWWVVHFRRVGLMAELFAYNEKVETIFDLIGDRENDITKSIAWAFEKCPRLLERVIDKLIHVNVDADDVVIRYQEFEKDRRIIFTRCLWPLFCARK